VRTLLNEKRGSQVNRLKLVEKERDALDSAKQEAEAYMVGGACTRTSVEYSC
jgi:hypothetical protein